MPLRLLWALLLMVHLAVLSPAKAAATDSESSMRHSSGVRSFSDLEQLAQGRVRQAFVAPRETPAVLRKLDYDGYRHILFQRERGIWWSQGRPFWLEMFHQGFVQRNEVKLHLIAEGKVADVPFSKEDFHYWGPMTGVPLPDDLPFAGLKVVGNFPGRNDGQEILTLLGASYFRARAAEQVYGASARGLAIDIGTAGKEEFPAFRELWVARPEPEDRQLKILALLEGPSVEGAYELTLTPGDAETTVDVRATVWFRRVPEKVGIAPLTSMWMWGDGLAGPEEDHRPEVHDSDMLLMHSADDRWTCRSLGRLTYPSVVKFEQPGLKGFGLLQRDVDPEDYLDQEARYHQRPSVWVQPTEAWGAGAVELLELPARHEGIDNIAAYWSPATPVSVTEPLRLAYRVTFGGSKRSEETVARVVAARVERKSPELLHVEVDFDGTELALCGAREEVKLRASSVRGGITASRCVTDAGGLCTAMIDVRPAGADPVELTVTLTRNGRDLSETWKGLYPVAAPPVSLPPWRLKDPHDVHADEPADTD